MKEREFKVKQYTDQELKDEILKILKRQPRKDDDLPSMPKYELMDAIPDMAWLRYERLIKEMENDGIIFMGINNHVIVEPNHINNNI